MKLYVHAETSDASRPPILGALARLLLAALALGRSVPDLKNGDRQERPVDLRCVLGIMGGVVGG